MEAGAVRSTHHRRGVTERHDVRAARRWTLAAWLLAWVATSVVIAPRAALPDHAAAWTTYGFPDYRDTVWVPLHDFATGHVPWDTKAYLLRHPWSQEYLAYVPSYWWFVAPLHLLPYRASVVVWLGLTTLALAWMSLASLRLFAPATLARRPWLAALVFFLVMATRPGKTSISLGQCATLCAVGAAWALLQVPGHDRRRAVVATMLAIVKPPVGLPLLGLQVLTRRGRTAGWALLASLLLAAPIGLVVEHRTHGWAATARLLVANLQNKDGTAAQRTAGPTTRVDTLALFHNAHIPLSGAAQLVVMVATAAVLAGLYAHGVRRLGVLDSATVALGALAVTMVTPNIMYCLIALVPAVVALAADLPASRGRDRGLLLAALCGLLVPFLLPQGVLPALGASDFVTGLVNNLALVFAAAVLAVLLLRRVRATPVLRRAQAPTDDLNRKVER